MKRTRLASSACGLAAAVALLVVLSSLPTVAEGRVNGKRIGGKKAKNYLANKSHDVSRVSSSAETAHHDVFPTALLAHNGPLPLSGTVDGAVEVLDVLHDQQADQEQSERKTMKAEQSDVDFTIDNNAGGNNNGNNNKDKDKDKNNVFGGGGGGGGDNDGVDPDEVKGDPRELPLPGKDADDADGSSGNNGQNGGEDGSDGNDSNNNGGNGGGGQDGQKGGTSDGPTGTGSNGGNGSTLNGGDNINDPGTYGSLQNDGSKGTNGGGADGETDGSGFPNGGNTNNADGSSADKNTPVVVSDPTLPYADANNDGINDLCQTSHDSLFGSEAAQPSQTKIVRYTYEVEFVLDDIDSLLGALSKLETALGDQLVPKMFSECQSSGAEGNGGWNPPPGIEVNSERDRARNNQDGQRRRRRVQELEGVVGMSTAPEDKPYPGFPCTVIDPPVEHGCVVMEGQLTLHLSEDADDDEVIDQTQDIIATSMDDNDALLKNIDPVIYDVAYVSDGPFLPATTEVSLRSDGENETQDFPFAVAGGAAAAFVGIMLILLGIKMKRNKNADDDDDSDAHQDVDDQDALNSSDLSHDDVVKEIAGGPMAYDMKKLTSPSQLPRGSDDSFESTLPVDGAGNTVLTGTPHGDSTMMSASILGDSGDSASANGKLGILPPNDSSIVDMSTSNFLSQSDGSRLLASHDDGKSTTSQSVGAGSHVSVGNSTILNDIV